MKQEMKMTGYPSIDKPWLKFYSREEIDAKPLENTVYEHLLAKNAGSRSHWCLSHCGTRLAYGDFFEKVDKVASALVGIGVSANDIATIAMLNEPEAILLFLALNKIGAAANMVYGALSEQELKRQIHAAKSKFVFALDVFQEKFSNMPDAKKVVCISSSKTAILCQPDSKPQNFLSWNEFLANADSGGTEARFDKNATALIVHTSGTTGESKAVMLDNEAILSALAQSKVSLGKDAANAQKFLANIPFHILYGILMQAVFPLSLGKIVEVARPGCETLRQSIERLKPDVIYSVPSQLNELADSKESLDLSNLNAIFTCGDFLSPADEKKINDFLKKNGCNRKLFNCYAMSEVIASTNAIGKYQFGSVGIPLCKTSVAAFDDDGNEMTYGQQGELCVLSSTSMQGYLDDKAATSEKMRVHKDGKIWVHTGDLGYVSKEGFVYLIGRKKRFFVAKNWMKKIYCAEIEHVIRSVECVKNCVVVPVFDKDACAVPVAFVRLSNEFDTKDIEKKLRSLCDDKLEFPARPVKYDFVDEFPLTKAGKIDFSSLENMV